MNTVAALPEQVMPLVESESPAKGTSRRGPRLNPYLATFALTTALALATASECESISHLPSLIYGLVLWEWWGCVASVIWLLGRKTPSTLRFTRRAISSHLLIAVGLGVVHLLLLGGLGFITPEWRQHWSATSIWTSHLNINRYGIEILLYGFIFGIAATVSYQIQAQRDAMSSIQLQKQLSAAHLRALQMQIEPHFLFNTLNAITTLVELGRQKEAVQMLSHLNSILQSTLRRTAPEKVPLSEELEIIDDYLAIEQVRFADRLRVELRVDPNALDGLVPCFLLQPIVENAIRHGIANCESEGVVEASAKREGNALHLRVRDTGRNVAGTKQNGHGIGLKNTRERLAHFYRDEYAMRAQPLEMGGFEVAITIPYERG